MEYAERQEKASCHDDPQDPLRASVRFDFHHVLFPFGFPVCVKSNEQSVIRAAEDSWGAFRQTHRVAPIEVRFVVSEVPSRRRPPIPSFRAQANLLTLIADKDNFGCCDLAAGFGFASVTKAAATHKEYLRYYFLESMAYILLDTRYMIAVHASCVEFEGKGVLFLGASGAGKSSLAYAAARRGWAYLCDDAASLILHNAGRTVVGNSQTIRFRPSALSLFPEIKGQTKPRNGKPTIEIRTEHLKHVNVLHESNIDYVVFLKRSSESIEANVTPVPRHEALRRLSNSPWPDELPVHEERTMAIERLLAAKAIELEYREFDPALTLLERMIHRDKS